MTIYYLQQSKNKTRYMIDTKIHTDFELIQQTEAKNWIQAKLNFGYPLTSEQEYLLEN